MPPGSSAKAPEWGFFIQPFWGDYGQHSHTPPDYLGALNLSNVAESTLSAQATNGAQPQHTVEVRACDHGYGRLIRGPGSIPRMPEISGALLSIF